ncbi:MAG: septum formation protein Maf [Fretibacterium sp.]|nr:septum formation protein Maf [Fretibacterium sp.]
MDFPELILASASPRRRALLSELGLRFSVTSPEVDESARPGEVPEALCERLARLKAEACPCSSGPTLVLAADTVVVVEERVLGKPRDDEENREMLALLEGRFHLVLTGVALKLGSRFLSSVEKTKVYFRPLSEALRASYVATGEGRDKAGGYAIQGKGSILVERLEGDYFNVVGLPLCRVGLMLEELGFSPASFWGC